MVFMNMFVMFTFLHGVLLSNGLNWAYESITYKYLKVRVVWPSF